MSTKSIGTRFLYIIAGYSVAAEMKGQGIDGGVTVAIARASAEPGLDIIDPIERRRCTLLTGEPVSPREVDPEQFLFPVDTAVEIEATEIHAPFTGHAYVRDQSSSLVEEVVNGFEGSFPAQAYSLDIAGLIKIYIEFDSSFTARQRQSSFKIAFDEPTTVTIGSRSLHTRPAATITTTADPRDILTGISTFGSALKTVSPERSFPTLRGHPPAMTLGEELDIPTGLEAPVNDVRIEVPPQFDFIYPVATLAYYLGVRVVPGQIPRIVGAGLDYSLDHPNGFDRKVEEVLQQVFLLDCVTRTEGYYPVNLYEREQVERRVDLPLSDLYTASMADRLQAYLEIPYAVLKDIVPQWRLAAHVDSTPESVSMLSYLANDLAVITKATPERIPNPELAPATPGFTRGGTSSQTRGTSSTEMSLVRPSNGPSALDTAWVSEGTPVEATKAVPDAYQNRFGRTPQDESISIAVVCNSADMDEERAIVNQVYGNHETMPFEVEVHESLHTEALREVLQRDFNFVHYIGHIDDAGFRCPDGRLDLGDVSDVAPEAFFLNACQSYEQGLNMVKRGAIGGIVTLNDVVNHGAVRIGQAVARLLNNGFPLRAALDIASNRSIIGRQYVVVGDGTLSIVQPPGGTPQSNKIEQDGEQFKLRVEGYGSPPGMGCLFRPFIPGNSYQYLAEGVTPEFSLDREEIEEYLTMQNIPVKYENTLAWSYELELD